MTALLDASYKTEKWAKYIARAPQLLLAGMLVCVYVRTLRAFKQLDEENAICSF